MGSARLLSIEREGETAWCEVDRGPAGGGQVTYEVAAASLPPDLPAPGDELDAASHRALALAAERKRAARRLFALLDRRLQPVAKLRDRLLDEGFHPEAVTAVLAAMHEQDVHSDRRFAEAWCRDCLLSRAVGRRYLESRLREAGVAPDLAQSVAAKALDTGTEDELARSAAAACWRRTTRAGPRTDPRELARDLARVTRFLLGRGFSPATASRAARATRPAPGGPGGPGADDDEI
jgi:SOS response regulatory protein OraA/RecX